MGESLTKLDIRTTDNVRALLTGDDQKMVIEGYAAVINKPSNPMPFIEYMKPGAFDHTNLDNVMAIYSHNFEDILARTDSDTLTLKVDDQGLFFTCILPDTQLGHDIYTNVSNGNIKGASFRFEIEDDQWLRDSHDNLIHNILSITNVTEISLTPIPAYSQTSVGVKRSMDEFLNKGVTRSMNDDEMNQVFDEFIQENGTNISGDDLQKKFSAWLKKRKTENTESTDNNTEKSDDSENTVDQKEDTKPVAMPKDDVSQLKGRINTDSKKKDETTRDDEDIDDDDEEIRETKIGKEEKRDMTKVLQEGANYQEGKKSAEIRSFENYIRSRGEIREGVTTVNNEAVIPTQILDIQKEKSAPNVLKNFVNRQIVSAPKGTLPVLKKASAGLVTKEELAKNPELAMSIEAVDYSVETYAGVLPISQEMIDDSAVDISSIAGQYTQDVSDITEDRKIGEALQTATKVANITTADDLKHAFNTKVPAGYDKMFVLSQSFYDVVDTMKDSNGRYLFQDSLASPSGKILLGVPVVPVDDNVIGKDGEVNGFVGDLKSFILDAVKKEVTVRWQDNDLYAQKLAAYLRFDVKKAIDEAGVLLKYAAPTTVEKANLKEQADKDTDLKK